jgi:hypothetical protein
MDEDDERLGGSLSPITRWRANTLVGRQRTELPLEGRWGSEKVLKYSPSVKEELKSQHANKKEKETEC